MRSRNGRIRNRAEVSISERLKEKFLEHNLEDHWNEQDLTPTWTNGKSVSQLDRILTRGLYDLKAIKSEWSISTSDHSMVTITREASIQLPHLARLDTRWLTVDNFVLELKSKLISAEDQILNHWDPHTKLDYMKMSLRSAASNLIGERKKKEKQKEEMIDEEIEIAMDIFINNDLAPVEKNKLQDHIDDLKLQKIEIIKERAAFLAEKMKDKWTDEGEKSTKYFLNLQKRPCTEN